MPNQIILGNPGIYLPEVSHDRYSCWEDPQVVEVDMISGRRVQEVRSGKLWWARYEFDSLGTDLLRKVLAILRSGAPFDAAVLPDNSDTMVASRFVLEELTQPTYAFSLRGKGLWHNIGFTIREEVPHD